MGSTRTPRRSVGPIITSLLDLDLYKLTMLQFIWWLHRDVPVTFAFRNRTTSVQLGAFVQLVHLQRELDHVRTLRFTDDEIAYLAALGGGFNFPAQQIPVGAV